MPELTLTDRIKGCLIGSAIGAELGFAKAGFAVKQPMDIFSEKLEPNFDVKEQRGRVAGRKVTPFIDIAVRAYIEKQGRITPEDFGKLMIDDPGLSGPDFLWDNIHTIQELLKEGMNPRLTGHGIAPGGNMAAAMPAVGIFHYADPDYAYLDGVELASITQPRLGADWAALCAAAIAAALDADATPAKVVETVLKLAHENNKELFYQINPKVNQAARVSGSDETFADWWYNIGGRMGLDRDNSWWFENPIRYVLPVLKRYADKPEKLMALLCACHGGPTPAIVYPVIGGAIAGALYGPDAFPQEWLEWAEPIAAQWFPILDVVKKRASEEKAIIATVNRLSEKDQDGNSLLFEKVYGCVLAGAIGNAMGSPVENQLYWEIDEKHPGGITTVLDPGRLEGEDDNQMAMLLVETYLERAGRPVMARHFGKTWKERLNRDHFFPLCMGNSYDLICRGWDPRITGHWNVVTGSTVMCMEPVGVYHLADPEFARIDATAVSYMYQRGLDVTAAAILCAAVAEALKPDATVDSVCQAALSASPKEKMNTFDKRDFNSPYEYISKCLEIAEKYDDVLAIRAELYEKCLFYHMIDPLELLGFAFAIFKVADGDVRQAAIGGTNIGRDSDTISGRAAMLAGTLKGAKTVPQEWVSLFTPESLEKIKRNSARLADFIATQKVARLARRQQLV